MTDESASLPLSEVQAVTEAVRANIAAVIVGKLEVIDLLLVALLSDGHVLLEDVPGMGKTVMAKAGAETYDLPVYKLGGREVWRELTRSAGSEGHDDIGRSRAALHLD